MAWAGRGWSGDSRRRPHTQIARFSTLDLNAVEHNLRFRRVIGLLARGAGYGGYGELEIKLELSNAKAGQCGAQDSENADRSGASQNMGVRGPLG